MLDLMPSDQDLLYEEELLRNPYSLKLWWRYIDARKDVSTKRRYLLYERALKALPGSYKVACLILSVTLHGATWAAFSGCVSCWIGLGEFSFSQCCVEHLIWG